MVLPLLFQICSCYRDLQHRNWSICYRGFFKSITSITICPNFSVTVQLDRKVHSTTFYLGRLHPEVPVLSSTERVPCVPLTNGTTFTYLRMNTACYMQCCNWSGFFMYQYKSWIPKWPFHITEAWKRNPFRAELPWSIGRGRLRQDIRHKRGSYVWGVFSTNFGCVWNQTKIC